MSILFSDSFRIEPHILSWWLILINSLCSENKPTSDLLFLVKKFCSTYFFKISDFTNFDRKFDFEKIFFLRFHFIFYDCTRGRVFAPFESCPGGLLGGGDCLIWCATKLLLDRQAASVTMLETWAHFMEVSCWWTLHSRMSWGTNHLVLIVLRLIAKHTFLFNIGNAV